MHPFIRLVGFMTLFATSTRADDLGLKDVILGTSLAQFVKSFEHTCQGDPRRAPALSCGPLATPAGKSEPTGYRKMGMIAATKTFEFENRDKPTGTNDTIAGVPANVTYWFFAVDAVDWDNVAEPYAASEGMKIKTWNDWNEAQWASAAKIHLGIIRVRFSPTEFSTVSSALEAKYGAPTSSRRTIEGRVLSWDITPEDHVTASERTDQLSIVEITRDSIKRRAKAFFEAASKANAADL